MIAVTEFISKSQKKRDAAALQKLGVSLTALSLEELDQLPLSDSQKQAIIAAKSIRSHGGMRRQAQLIGKLMRMEDPQALIDAYQALCAQHSAQTQSFHDIELWRKRFMAQDSEALTAFVATYPRCDVQRLRQSIQKALAEQAKQVNQGAAKALFRMIKATML